MWAVFAKLGVWVLMLQWVDVWVDVQVGLRSEVFEVEESAWFFGVS